MVMVDGRPVEIGANSVRILAEHSRIPTEGPARSDLGGETLTSSMTTSSKAVPLSGKEVPL
jgi:hypothetical protein